MLADSLEESPPLRPFLRDRVPHTYYWGAKTTAAVTSWGYSHAAAPPASGASQAPRALPEAAPPGIPPRTGRALTRAAPRPAGLRQGGQAGFPLALPPTQPARFLTRDGQPRGRRLGLPPQAPAAIIAFAAGVPARWGTGDPGREGACQLRLGGHGAVRRDPRLLAARGRRSRAGRYAAPPGTPDASSSTTPGPEAQARLP
jgi:hypothetical protein